METVPVSMRLSADIRALLGELANRDHRTMAGWVSAVVEREAEIQGLKRDQIVAKAKEKRAAAVKPAPKIPDFIDPEIWADFVEHRKNIKKPINDSTMWYMMPDIMKAHNNGWDVNELIANAIAKGWAAFVFHDPHKISRPNGKEIVVKAKLTPAEVAEKKAKLLNHEGLVGHNRDRFVDFGLIVELIDTAFETDQPLEMGMLSMMLNKFFRSGNKEKCNQWLRDLIDSQNILNDDGEFIGMRCFQ